MNQKGLFPFFLKKVLVFLFLPFMENLKETISATGIRFSEQELIRRQSLQEIKDLGLDPYPAASFEVNGFTEEVKDKFEKGEYLPEEIKMSGRLMTRRIMGNASFAEIQDSKGRIQIYLKRDEICEGEDKTLYNIVFKKLMDIGDFVGIKGFVFRTQTGEISIHVKEMTLLAKSLKPLPIVKMDGEGHTFDAVSDPEFRYRQRYADLIINPEVKATFRKRTKIIQSLRNSLNEQDFLEVETPILQSIPGGATARPFITHHNALDIPLYLRIANELYLKRLIIGGFEGVYEFAKDFRNEGMDRTHNPEFTILEFYVAYRDYIWMMNFTEKILAQIAQDLYKNSRIHYQGKEIDFAGPYKKIPIFDAIQEYTGYDIRNLDEKQLRAVCLELKIPVNETMGLGKLVDEIFSTQCEHHFIQPTFIIDYPVEMSPLTKKHRIKAGLVERFELFINGKEIANAYSELNDPIDQRERFEEQLLLSQRGDHEAMFIDYDFLRALEYGMPPTAGIGIGIDRLTMLMTNQHSIQDVLFFPQMRPENIG